MSLASSVITQAPEPSLSLLLPSDYPVIMPPVFSRRMKHNIPLWLFATMTPDTGITSANIDYVNNTHFGWGSISMERQSGDPMSGARFCQFSGRRKPGAAGFIVDNLVKINVNAIEVARIYVDAETQSVGWTAFALPADRLDTRFALSGASTTGDLIFALAFADPALELQLLIGGEE